MTGALWLASPHAACEFEGPTDIVLNGASNSITVHNAIDGTMTFNSANGYNYRVIYVEANSGVSCSDAYTPFGAPYDDPANNTTAVGSEYVGAATRAGTYGTGGADGGCGDAYVSGSFGESMTIAAAGDVVINGSITNVSTNSTAVLGLVATHFVRIFHPISGASYNSSCTAKSNAASDLTSPTINAAILADQDSFIVDNYNCGASLGNLNVIGSIAQDYRGPISSPLNSNTVTDGYAANYGWTNTLATVNP